MYVPTDLSTYTLRTSALNTKQVRNECRNTYNESTAVLRTFSAYVVVVVGRSREYTHSIRRLIFRGIFYDRFTLEVYRDGKVSDGVSDGESGAGRGLERGLGGRREEGERGKFEWCEHFPHLPRYEPPTQTSTVRGRARPANLSLIIHSTRDVQLRDINKYAYKPARKV